MCLALSVGTSLYGNDQWALLRWMRHAFAWCNTENLAGQVLLGIAAGAWLLTPKWLTASADAGQWLDEQKFEAEVPFPSLMCCNTVVAPKSSVFTSIFVMDATGGRRLSSTKKHLRNSHG